MSDIVLVAPESDDVVIVAPVPPPVVVIAPQPQPAVVMVEQVSGPIGPQGPQGQTGASSSVFFYKADTHSTGTSDPGTGFLRWNNVNQQAATQLIVDRLTTDGFDALAYFRVTDIGDEIAIQDADFSYNYQVFAKTGAAVEFPDYFAVPVAFLFSGGTGSFSHNTRLAVLLKVEGAIGPQGPGGAQGPMGPQGPTGDVSGLTSGNITSALGYVPAN